MRSEGELEGGERKADIEGAAAIIYSLHNPYLPVP